MDLLLLAIRTSRPIFVREGGGGVEECHRNCQWSLQGQRVTPITYDFVHYLNQRPPFKGNFAPPTYVTREIWRGEHVCIGVQRAIFPPSPPPLLHIYAHSLTSLEIFHCLF